MMRRLSLLLAIFAAAYAAADAQAAGRLAAARAARADATLATASLPDLQAAAPAPEIVIDPACCPQPCLTYRHRGHHRGGNCCLPPIETVLTATDPCTCCPVAIPVCLPGCCQGAPCVSCHRGLFGTEVVDFDWACGFRVTVRFKHNGKVVVVTRG